MLQSDTQRSSIAAAVFAVLALLFFAAPPFSGEALAAPLVVGGVTLSATPPACVAPDVPVWADTTKSMFPVTYGQTATGTGGYTCFSKGKAANFTFAAWNQPTGAATGCGGQDKVASFPPQWWVSQIYFQSWMPEFSTPGYQYSCESLLIALGLRVGTSVGVVGTTTIPPCPGDVPVKITKGSYPGVMMPSTASDADIQSITGASSGGYSCAGKAQTAKFTLGSWPTNAQAKCGSDKIVALNPGTRTFYETFSLGSGYYNCETLVAALGWTKYVPPAAAPAPGCPGGDLPVWLQTYGPVRQMEAVTQSDAGQGNGSYGCAKAAKANNYVPRTFFQPTDVQCGSDKIVALRNLTLPGPMYENGSPYAPKVASYQCESLMLALGWTLAQGPPPPAPTAPPKPKCTNYLIDYAFAAAGLTVNGSGKSGDCDQSRYEAGLLSGDVTSNARIVSASKLCDEPWIGEAYMEQKVSLSGAGSAGDCDPDRYAASSWKTAAMYFGAFERLENLVTNSKRCSDPWTGEAFMDAVLAVTFMNLRKPTAAECDPSLYGPRGTGAAGYAQLVASVQAYLTKPPPPPPVLPVTLSATKPTNCAQGAAWANTTSKTYYLDGTRLFGASFVPNDPNFGYACTEVLRANLWLGGFTGNNPVPAWAQTSKPTNCPDGVVWINDRYKVYVPEGKPGFGLMYSNNAPGTQFDFGYACTSTAKSNGYTPYP